MTSCFGSPALMRPQQVQRVSSETGGCKGIQQEPSRVHQAWRSVQSCCAVWHLPWSSMATGARGHMGFPCFYSLAASEEDLLLSAIQGGVGCGIYAGLTRA